HPVEALAERVAVDRQALGATFDLAAFGEEDRERLSERRLAGERREQMRRQLLLQPAGAVGDERGGAERIQAVGAVAPPVARARRGGKARLLPGTRQAEQPWVVAPHPDGDWVLDGPLQIDQQALAQALQRV